MSGSGSQFEPTKPPGHVGHGTKGTVAFANGERTWTEEYDLLELLENALRKHELSVSRESGWLLVNELYLRPEFVEVQPLEPSGVRTATTISVVHETKIPGGLFEYQHSSGSDINAAIAAGFDSWIELDAPVIMEAVTDDLSVCTAMDMEYSEPVKRVRRTLLGPVVHFAGKDYVADEEHPFCPCCLLTNSLDAFQQQFDGTELFGVRLLVIRSGDGEVSADCRVNGVDWELGREHLINYGQIWSGHGYELRKQYVIIYTKPSAA